MAHVVALVARRVSCQLLDVVKLLRCRNRSHRCLNRACTVLDPLLV